MFKPPAPASSPARIALLASGTGSNVMAVLEAISQGRLQAEVCLVLSDEPEAPVLDKAARAGVPVACVPRRDYPTREAFEAALARWLTQADPQLIVLAGFMRVLSGPFVRRFERKMINLHPSLLPDYPGLNTHQRVLDAGETEHGASVHWVTDVLDGGEVIRQRRVKIKPGDTAETLRERVQKVEHQLLPDVVAEVAAHWRAGE